jgi:hypothetical protein
MMVFNNERCKELTPHYIDTGRPNTLEWSNPIGELPAEWNHCVGYDAPRKDAKIVHYTMGIPFWPETSGFEYASEWMADAKESMSTVSWAALMGGSVHAQRVRNAA